MPAFMAVKYRHFLTGRSYCNDGLHRRMSTSEPYAVIYLACAFLAAFGLMMRFARRMTEGERLLSIALVVPLIVIYLIGMHRIAGEDFDNYARAYNELDDFVIPDPGYTALTWLTRRIGLDLPGFFLTQAVFTLWVLTRVSRKNNADPVVVIVIYLLHLAVGRDLSQSRIGLAVVVYLLGQSQDRRWLKLVLYALASSIHITVVVLALSWGAAGFISRQRPHKRWLYAYFPLIALAIAGSQLLGVVALADPRVEIYLAWDAEGFGAPLSSFGALARTLPSLIVLVAASRRFRNLDFFPYVLMELAGAAILLGFAEFSIFAARLSNVAISMYPVGIGVVAAACQSAPLRGRTSEYGLIAKMAVAVTVAVLLARPGNVQTLSAVVPVAYDATKDWD